MQPDNADRMYEAHNVSMMLLTLLIAEETGNAVRMIANDKAFDSRMVSTILGTYAACAIRMIAQLVDSEPLDIVQSIAVVAAKDNFFRKGEPGAS